MNSLLQKQNVATRSEGDMVVLRIGNSEVKMPYSAALKLSQWLRVSGKEAKRNAGDVSRHWSVVADLTDAEEAIKNIRMV